MMALQATNFAGFCTAAGVWTSLKLDESNPANRRMLAPEGGLDPHELLTVTPLNACLSAGSSAELVDTIVEEKRKGERSELYHYLTSCCEPASWTLPRFWSTSQIERVRCPSLSERMMEEKRAVASAESKDHIWAEAVVSTRAAYVDDGRIALVPMLDMINHCPWGKPTSCVVNDQHVELSTAARFEDGQEVFIKYGDLSNSAMLLDYGFLPNDDDGRLLNPDDHADVVVDVVNEMGKKRRVTIRCLAPYGIVSDKSLASLRGALLSPSEAFMSSPAFFTPGNLAFASPVSPENERAVQDLLVREIGKAATFASLSEDLEEVHQDHDTVSDLIQQFNRRRSELLWKSREWVLATRPGSRIGSLDYDHQARGAPEARTKVAR